MRKYELTEETKTLAYGTVHRIRALMDISRYGVKAGDLGGWIEKYDNLSQDGDAWVFGNAEVYANAEVCGNAEVRGNAKVRGNAWVCDTAKVFVNAFVCDDAVVYDNAEVRGNAKVYGNAWVYDDAEVGGNAEVCGNALVCDTADYITFKNSWSSGRWFTYTRSNKMWKVGCFYGTGEELIKKAYADSVVSGKCYEAIVRAVETIELTKADALGPVSPPSLAGQIDLSTKGEHK